MSINWKLVEERRIAAGLTRRELAEQLGEQGFITDYLTVSYLTASRTRHGEEDEEIRLHTLGRLCPALNLDIVELFRPPASTRRRPKKTSAINATDDAVLEAALAGLTDPVGHSALTNALDWPLERLGTALQVLDERLAGTGTRVDHDAGPPALIRGLRPCDAVLSPTQREALRRLTKDAGPLDVDDARTLYEIIMLGLGPTETSDRVSTAAALRLERQGYVRPRHESERLTASDALSISLMLDDLASHDDVG